MKIEIHTLAWTNVDNRIVNAQSKVCKQFGLSINYTFQNIRHGEWMDAVISNTDADAILFLDIDCVPTNETIAHKALSWSLENNSFLGIAQVSNHIPPYSHIFAAPAFFAITKSIWEKMGKPTFQETEYADVAENVSYTAEILKINYKTLYPTHYFKEPSGGIWKLHTYGEYGIGTFFEGGIFHLYQGRVQQNIELFQETCNKIQDGTLKMDNYKYCHRIF